MQIHPLSSLRCGWVPWTTAGGKSFATIIAKLTFDITDGGLRLSEEQDDLIDDDLHFDQDDNRSLEWASDLAPFKARADVVVTGHAHSVGGQPTHLVRTRLAIRECDKRIDVLADRAFGIDGNMREGARFLKLPLRYERAAGGPGSMNPVGVSSQVRDALGRLMLPNLQPPNTHVERPGDPIATVGYGPIAATWPPRLELGQRGAHLGVGHVDPAFYNVAPSDQQLAELAGDEAFVLEGLSARRPLISGRLAKMQPRAFLLRGESLVPVALRLDTLVFDTDRDKLVLTWRGQLEDQEGLVYLAIETANSPVGAKEIERLRDDLAEPIEEAPTSDTVVPTTRELNQVVPPPVLRKPATTVTRILPESGGPTADWPKQPAKTIVTTKAGKDEPPPPALRPGRATASELSVVVTHYEFIGAVPEAASAARHLLTPAQPSNAGAADADPLWKLLGNRTPSEESDLEKWLGAAKASHGIVVAHKLVARGTLELEFDPRERLVSLVSVASRLAAADSVVAELVEEAREAVAAGTTVSEVADALADSIVRGIEGSSAREHLGSLELQVERAVLERRGHRTRTVFGSPHVLARLVRTRDVVTAYVPKTIADALPLLRRHTVTLLGEVRPAQEMGAPPACLRVLALARGFNASPA